MKNNLTKIAAAVALSAAASSSFAEWSANATVSNNYLWRGLTQTVDEPMVSGGIDYADESGFYIGTWAANVSYAADDAYSYEHDVYFGFAGEAGDIGYDVGYLYYNYNDAAGIDFSEIYGSVSYEDFSLTAYVMVHTEAEESDAEAAALEAGYLYDYDFGFGSAWYLSADYGVELSDGWSMGLHLGYHDGDFVEYFNFADVQTFDYIDYSVSFAKDAFTFTISDTDLDGATHSVTHNGDVKYVVSYDFEI